jgi:hypothetical protein
LSFDGRKPKLNAVHKLFVLLAFLPAVPFCQTTVHTSLAGRVTDPTGAVVHDAKLVLSRTETGARYQVLSDSEGQYVFPRLEPGHFTLTVEKAGFERLVREGLNLSVGSPATADLSLRVGDVTTQVSVMADADALQTRSSDVSLLIDTARIQDLPLNARDFQKLLFLAPGVGGQRSNNGATNNSTSGARDLHNNYVVDGLSINDERQTAGVSPGLAGHANLRVPNVMSTEALQEFRIVTANADATYGRSSGAQINVITKSGTNSLHGSLYEFWRNDVLDARDFFNNGPFRDQQGRAIVPPFNQNLFGGSVGGPLQKNRHFFFGNYEGFRQRLQDTATLTLPTADMVRQMPGDLGRLFRTYYFDLGVLNPNAPPEGTVIPFGAADRNAAVAAGYAAQLFDGNPGNGEAGSFLSSRSSTRDFDQNAFLVRTDHLIRENWALSFRHADTGTDRRSSTGNLPGSRQVFDFAFRSFGAQSTHTISPAQTLELRAGILRGKNQSGLDEDLAPYYALGIDPANSLGVALQGLPFRSVVVGQSPGWLDNQMTTQGGALHSLTRGSWTLRSGMDIRRINVNFGNLGFGTPSYTFTGLIGPNGILGSSSSATQATALSATAALVGQNGGPTNLIRGWRSTQQEYFSQLDWRVRPRLTVNLGIRYSYFGVYNEANGFFSNLYAVDQSGNVIPDADPFQFGRLNNRVEPIAGKGLYAPDRNNFQPRVGFAWLLTESGNTVLRGAYGLYNDRITQIGMSNMTLNPPYAIDGTVNNVPFILGRQIQVTPRLASIFGINPDLRSAALHRANVMIERQFGADTTVSVGYVGAFGRDLLRYIEPNLGSSFPQNLRPDQRYGWQRIYGNYSTSEYNSLQLVARRRFSKGFTFTGTYTYSNFYDDSSADAEFASRATLINVGASPAPGIQGGTQFVERPIRADYSHSEYETPHVGTLSVLWDLPFGRGRNFGSGANRFINALFGGWSLSSLAVMRNGTTFNVANGVDYNDDGAFDDRPALIGGASLDAVRARGLDKTQFLLPQSEAQRVLGVPADVTDPFAVIPRLAFRAPAVYNFDVSALKQFSVWEGGTLRFEVNCFNVPNRTHLALPNSTLSSATFGRITSTVATTTPRQFQLGAKLIF